MGEGSSERKSEGSGKGSNIKTKFHVNDRVKRSTGAGMLGTVKDVRIEVTASSDEAKEKSVMFLVQWDNGTLSIFGQEGLLAA